MVAQIHVLRNLMTNALLTVNAMVDGKLPPDRRNLHELAQTLDDVSDLVANVSKYDLAYAGDRRVIDVCDMVRSVVNDLALVSSATDVGLTAVEVNSDDIGCRALRGNWRNLHESFEGALRALLGILPPGATIAAAPRSAATITLTVSIPDQEPQSLATYLAAIAPPLERHRGQAHHGAKPGEYCLHLPGTSLCSGATECAPAR
jgi:hypothetical protein